MRTIVSTSFVAAAMAIQLADTETKSFAQEFAEFFLANFDINEDGKIQMEEVSALANYFVQLEDLSPSDKLEGLQTYGSDTGEELWFADTARQA